MENENLTIFNEQYIKIGKASREEAHKKGYWHETFHCWLVSRDKDKIYLLFQLRSAVKKDYPNLLDITAAGHILDNESIDDGVREVKEEIGLALSFQDLIKLGVFKYSIIQGDLIDRELANVFLYENEYRPEEFLLQKEEVAGLFKAELNCYSDLLSGIKDEIYMEGFILTDQGETCYEKRSVGLKHFVPHEGSYYEMVIEGVKSSFKP